MEEGVALVLAFLLFLGLFLFLNLDIVLLGQITQCFGIGEMLMLFQESNNIAGFAAAKAFENAFGGRDIEGGGLLVVERAAANVVGSASPITSSMRAASIMRCMVSWSIIRFGVQRYDFFLIYII